MTAAASFTPEHPIEIALARAQSQGLRANLARWVRFAGHRPGDVLELQVLDAAEGRYKGPKFAHAETFAEAFELAERAERFDCSGVYVIANRLDPAVAARAGTGQWITALKGSSTSDRDVTARLDLFIDIDVKRPTGTSATAAQVQAAAAVASSIYDKLAPLVGRDALAYEHTGNGRALHVALDALSEAEAGPLVRGGLVALKFLYETPEIEIDTSVSEAKRLKSCSGTMKRKGARDRADRPHRRTAIVVPRSVRRLSTDELRALVLALRDDLDDAGRAAVDKAMGVKAPPRSSSSSSSSSGSRSTSGDSPFDRAKQVPIADVLEMLGLYEDGRPVCPGCGISDGSSVAIVGNGVKCSRARCASKGYAKGFRTTIDVVVEARGVTNVEAVRLLSERFGFAGIGESKAPTSPPAERFRIWTPAEIFAPLPAPEYAIGGLLLRSNLALVCAYGSSLKTWAIVDLLLAQASGEEWLGMFGCKPMAVLAVDWESGEYELRRRVQAVARARGMTMPVEGVHFVTMPALFFTDKDFETVIRELAASYKFIVFDSLSAGSVDVDENDPRFAQGLQILKRVGGDTGATFVVIHHSRKSKGDGDGDDREKVRGSGAIFAACDVVLQLFRRDDGSFLVRQTKARGGKAVDPFVLRVEDVDKDSTRVYATPAEEESPREAANAITALAVAKRRVLTVLASERDLGSKNAIYRRTKGTKTAVNDAIDELAENGVIVIHEGAYRLASEVSA